LLSTLNKKHSGMAKCGLAPKLAPFVFVEEAAIFKDLVIGGWL